MGHLDKTTPATIYHTTVLVSNFQKSLAFYDAFFALLGWESPTQEADAKAWSYGGFSFWIAQSKPEDSAPNAGGLGINHLAFLVDSEERVDEVCAWAQGMDSGFVDIASKHFPEYSENYYATFLFDPDGARLEVVYK